MQAQGHSCLTYNQSVVLREFYMLPGVNCWLNGLCNGLGCFDYWVDNRLVIYRGRIFILKEA